MPMDMFRKHNCCNTSAGCVTGGNTASPSTLGDRALGLAAERDRHAFADGGGYSREHAQGVALVVGVFEAGDDGLGRADARGQSFLRESVSFAEVVNGLCDAAGHLCGAHRTGPAWRLAKKLIDRGRAVVPRRGRHGCGEAIAWRRYPYVSVIFTCDQRILTFK